MFEDSLTESQHRLSSPHQRWITLASLAFQCAIAAGIVTLPLLHPEVLPFRSEAPSITLPVKPVPPPVPHVDSKASLTDSLNSVAALPERGGRALNFDHPMPTGEVAADLPPAINVGVMNGTNDIPAGFGTLAPHNGARVTLAQAPAAGPIRLSRGVSAGLLLSPIRPVYPPIAISTRTEGVVVIEATISKTGEIESARATSGPGLLRSAALEAVRRARYSPYLLNGQPTEVETTITVNFKLAG